MNKSINSTRKNNRHSQAPQTNSKVFISLLVITFILPWPHGGEIVWQYLIFCMSIFSIGTIYFINITNNKNNNTNNFLVLKSIKTPLILLGIWLLFQAFQIIPMPLYLTSNLSNIAEQNLNSNKWQSISIAPNVTLIEIIKHTSYITVFVLTLCLLNTKHRILTLANTLFFCSAIIALYSLVNHYTKGGIDLISSIPPWTAPWEKLTHGTFSYQNHYASFLTLTIPLGYSLLYANIKKNKNKKLSKGNLTKIIDLVMSINGLYILSILVMTITLFKTASRGGNAIFIISIAITFFCVILQQKESKKSKIKKIGLGIISILIITIVVITTGVTDSLTKRLNSQGYISNGRDLMHKTAFAIIQQSPFTGTGAGTYPVLQHKYKDPKLGATTMSKRAHNDYLELLTNQGVIGFSLLGLATLLLVLKLFKGLKKSRSNSTKSLYGLQVASFCSVTAILLHSLIDFNFHLPANAVYFYLILALGIKIPQIKKLM
jgi:O-antigen ligase